MKVRGAKIKEHLLDFIGLGCGVHMGGQVEQTLGENKIIIIIMVHVIMTTNTERERDRL